VTSRGASRAGRVRSLIAVLVAGAVLYTAPAGARADDRRGGEVRIDAIAHDASRPLRAGARLVVVLRGTKGVSATFTFADPSRVIEMEEIRPGVYRGVYTTKPTDAATNAAVVGWLRRGGFFAFAAAAPITIDTMPPQVVRREPRPGETVRTVRPTIVIATTDPEGAGLDIDASRLFVNGRDVTDRTMWTRTSVGYSPSAPLNGQVRVELVLADRAGNVTHDLYVFYVGAGPEAR
jgi:hypothetical protein